MSEATPREKGWLKRKHEQVKELFVPRYSPPKKKQCTSRLLSSVDDTVTGNWFEGLSFCLSNDLVKQYKELRSSIEKGGGTLTSFLNSKTSYYVTTLDEYNIKSYKVLQAISKGIKIVPTYFIDDCSMGQELLDYEDYTLEIKQELEEEEEEDKLQSEDDWYASENNTDKLDELELLQQSSDNESESERPLHWGLAKIYTYGSPNEPFFPNEYEVLKSDTLSYTDINTNENKFYSMELHKGVDDKEYFRVFTNYGRIEDLSSNKSNKDCRYLRTLKQATIVYDLIYQDKTAVYKGYEKINLSAVSVGSSELQKTLDNYNEPIIPHSSSQTKNIPFQISSEVKNLVNIFYHEATNELTKRISAQVTARGIETPLGLLTKNQIQKGNDILDEIESLLSSRKTEYTDEDLQKLSSKFYTIIPHSLGNTEETLKKAILNSYDKIEDKRDLLQLMEDMMEIINNFSDSNQESEIEIKYRALNCNIEVLDNSSSEYTSISSLVKSSCKDTQNIKNIYSLKRKNEWERFTDKIFNTRLLFHGSRIDNWLGLLSRGILMPRKVEQLGVTRTDAGLLGYGIYFAESFEASSKYTTISSVSPGSRFIAVCNVALGNIFHVTKSNTSLTEAPLNYHSYHGIGSSEFEKTDFEDSEYVVYDNSQQRLEYLIEFTDDLDELENKSDSEEINEMEDNSDDIDIDKEEDKIEQKKSIINSTISDSSSWLDSFLKDEEWSNALSSEFKKEYFMELQEQLLVEYATKIIYPPKELIFAAFNACSLSKVKVVIVGQDPYHNGNAEGLSFSSPGSPPPSLNNIFLELQSEYKDFQIPNSGSLISWAKQGVLLLNSVLTVRKGYPNSHQAIGIPWEEFTNSIFKILDKQRNRIVFLLWGNYAKQKVQFINNPIHVVLTTSHPSPYSVKNGFSTCKHFSKANEFLIEKGIKPINWHILPPKVKNQQQTQSLFNQIEHTPKSKNIQSSVSSKSKYTSISDMNCYNVNSQTTLIVRVLFKSGIHNWSTSKGQGLFFQMELMDSNGNTIKASSYNDTVIIFHSKFANDKIYEISNFNVKLTKHEYDKYYRTKNPLNIILTEFTSVIPQTTINNFPSYKPNWISIQEASLLPHENLVDIAGFVKEIGQLSNVFSKKGNSIPKRTIVIKDKTQEIQLTLWYNDAKSVNIPLHSVVGFTGVMVNIFRNRVTLSSKHCAFRIFKETDEYLNKLKEWVKSQNLIQNQSLTSKFIPDPMQIDIPIHVIQRQQMTPSTNMYYSNTERNTTSNFNYYQPSYTQGGYFSTYNSSSKDYSMPNEESESESVTNWSVSQVLEWLNDIVKLSKYCSTFKKNQITGKDLISLESSDLRDELEIYNFSDRKTILSGIELLKIQNPLLSANNMSIKEQASFIKETAFLLSTKSTKEIDVAIKFYLSTDVNIPIIMIQRILSQLPMNNLIKLAQNTSEKDIILPSILDTSRRTFVKKLTRREIGTISDVTENCCTPFFPLSVNQFTTRYLDTIEKEMIPIFPIDNNENITPNSPSVVTRGEFYEKFAEFTKNQLTKLNWDNCLVAGGSVLACLLQSYKISEIISGNQVFNQKDQWNNSDIDIFLVGLKEEQFNDKIQEIYDTICYANPLVDILVVRTKNCISFVSQYPKRTIQVILKEYSSYSEVLGAFDIDCVSVGFDGKAVWASPNAIRALNTKTNFMTDAYFKYEMNIATMKRLVKYYQRGFSARIYSESMLTIDHISSKISSRLLFIRFLFEKESKKQIQPSIGSRVNSSENGGYDDAYLPYGPMHTPYTIKQRLQRKLDENNGIPSFFIFGTLENCLNQENVPDHLLSNPF